MIKLPAKEHHILTARMDHCQKQPPGSIHIVVALASYNMKSSNSKLSGISNLNMLQ